MGTERRSWLFPDDTVTEATRSLVADGFVLLGPTDYRLERARWEDFAAFRSAWCDLPVDGYLPDGGAYRRRRYTCVQVVDGTVSQLPHQPFYQSPDINPAMGGVDKWFAPVPADVMRNRFFDENLLSLCALFERCLAEPTAWQVDVHLFRVTCSTDGEGFPIPGRGGLHREGKSFVSIQLIERTNILGGVSRVAHDTAQVVFERALEHPLDTLLVDDRTMLHDASSISVADATVSPFGHRDILNMDFQAVPRSELLSR